MKNETVDSYDVQKALQIYKIIKDFILENEIKNTFQVYRQTTNTWDGLRTLANCCDIVGYPKSESPKA